MVTRPDEGFSTETAARILAAAREQAAANLDRQDELVRDQPGQYIFLVDGRVVAEAATIAEAADIRPAVQREHGFGLSVHAVPPEEQVERLEAYR